MKIAAFGCEQDGLLQRIEAAAGALDLQVAAIEHDRPPAEIDGDWEILFLGGAEGQPLVSLITRLHDENPRGVIVALTSPRGEPEAMVEAGAFDVLSDEASQPELAWALTRAVQAFIRTERLMNGEKLQAITQLAAGVNHEINNPLTSVMGTAELVLIENKQLPEKLVRDIKTILTQSRRIQLVTLRLRDLDHLRTVPYDHRESMIDLSSAEEPTRILERREEREVSSPSSTPKLLVVDDNQLVIDLTERLLGTRFSVDHATCASDALGKLQFADYDLMLVDIIMPEMDGLELLRAIRRMKPRQRVFLTSAYQSSERIERCLAEGALGFIKKPFDYADLERRLWDAYKSENRASPPHRA